MTATAIEPLVAAYLLASPPRLRLPRRGAVALRRHCVRVEIKPHTSDSIRGGIRQLWLSRRQAPPRTAQRCDAIPGTRGVKTVPVLLTYQQHATNSRLFTIRALAGTTLEGLVQGEKDPRDGVLPGTSHADWQTLGVLPVPQAVRTIPLWSCGTTLGNLMEGVIRKEYAAAMSAAHPANALALPWRNPSGTGPDILHEELQAFLAELRGAGAGRGVDRYRFGDANDYPHETARAHAPDEPSRAGEREARAESEWEGEAGGRWHHVDAAIRDARARIRAHSDRAKELAANPGSIDLVAREAAAAQSWSTELVFLESLKAFFETQAGVALSYSMYPVTQVDRATRRYSRHNEWVEAGQRSRFDSGEQQGSFCLGAARSMAFRTLFGSDRPTYRSVLTELKKGIEAARRTGDRASEARLVISRIVSHTSATWRGPLKQFNADVGSRYRLTNVAIRPESRWPEARKALRQGAPVMADLGNSGWHWIMLRQSPRGRLWQSDPLSGGEIRPVEDKAPGTRFELIVDAATGAPVTPAAAPGYKRPAP